MNERDAFEKAIDSNPLEATTHLVYADWLDENGEEDEAAFRRAMGNWIAKGNPFFSHEESGHEAAMSQGFTHGLRKSSLPLWWRRHLKQAPTNDATEYPLHVGRTVGTPSINSPDWAHYRGYRNMEEGLRRAFMVTHRRGQSQKMSRLAQAVRRMRRS